MVLRLIFSVFCWGIVSCTFLGTDGAIVKEAVEIQNPATGRLEEATPGNSRSLDGKFYIKSFEKSGNICFLNRKEIVAKDVDTSVDRYFASSYPDIETFDKQDEKDPGVKAVSVRVVGDGHTNRTYRGKERVTFRDASGMTVATGERPVDKLETTQWSDTLICFPTAQVITKNAKYLVLKQKIPSLGGGDAVGVIAAWKFK